MSFRQLRHSLAIQVVTEKESNSKGAKWRVDAFAREAIMENLVVCLVQSGLPTTEVHKF